MTLDEIKVAVDSTIWVEKYKPTEIEDVLVEEHLKDKFKQYINTKDIPNLLFQGPPGNGKTTCAKMIANAISTDVLFINASSETGIDVVRHKIEPFCAVCGLGDGLKVVILDEMEMSSENFQTALREVIEKFYSSTRFIFTCNFINKVIEPLKSRTQEYKFGNIKQVDILKRCMSILDAENVEYDKKNLAKVVKNLGTDMRRIINAMQRLSTEKDGKITLAPFTTLEEKQLQVLDLIKERKFTDFRKFVGEQSLNPDELVKFIYNKCLDKTFGEEGWLDMADAMAEAAFRLKVGVDPEIAMSNGVSQLMRYMKE